MTHPVIKEVAKLCVALDLLRGREGCTPVCECGHAHKRLYARTLPGAGGADHSIVLPRLRPLEPFVPVLFIG